MASAESGAKKARKSTPFLLRIIVPMIMLSVLQIIIIVLVMTVNGEFTTIKKISYDSLTEKTENRGNYVENVLNGKTTLVYETAKEVNAVTERILSEEGLTAAAVSEDKQLNKRILSENVESLISLIRRDMVNDAFIILNTGSLYSTAETENLTGVYLRNRDANGYGADNNEDIYMEMGSSEIARAFGMTLDSGWARYLDVTDRDSAQNRFYFKTLEGYESHSETPLYRLGRWSSFASVAGASDESMKYALPLVASDGTVYGVIGVGLLKKTLLQSIPATDFFDDSACYVLAADLDENGAYEVILSSGPAYSRLVDGNTVLSRDRPLEYGMYDFTSDGIACIGCIRDLSFYTLDSPFRDQSWVLISVADEAKTLNIYNMLIHVFVITMGISLFAGILFAFFVSKSISSPVTKMMNALEISRKSNTLVAFSSAGISEIDDLAVSIVELQSDALEYGSRVSRIITMAGGKIGVFFCDCRSGSVFMGESLIKLLGFSSLPEGDATVSFEEFRRQLGTIDGENRLFGLNIFSEFEESCGEGLSDEKEEGASGCESIEILYEDRKSGAPRWLEFRVNRDGRNIVGLVQDITDTVTEKQKIAQVKDDEYTEKLIKANAALRDAYVVAKRANHAKTDFLSRMSHDIRTPMNAIIGMTAIAQMHLDDPQRAADCLGKIESSSRYLLSLINEVLDMSKIESGKFVLNEENFEIPALIDNVVEMIRPSLRAKKHELTIDAAGIEHESVIGDSLRIQQAFVNILGNAVKYTPEGGKIEFGITEKAIPRKGMGCYQFVFRDNGIGMSEEFLKRLYEPFERASDEQVNKEQGTGLGMAITKNIVEMMEGDIRVESEPGKGTTFTVTIFLKIRENAAVHAAEFEGTRVLTADGGQRSGRSLDALSRRDFSGIRALLTDDNELNIEIASEILQMTGLTIDTASNGKEALDRFAASPEGYYRMIFMDVQMPVMNGYEAARAIRDLDRGDAKTIPIIAMTANAFAEDVQAAKNAGMNEHIAKPLNFGRLTEVLNQWLGEPV